VMNGSVLQKGHSDLRKRVGLRLASPFHGDCAHTSFWFRHADREKSLSRISAKNETALVKSEI